MSVNLDNAIILTTAAYIQNARGAFGPEGSSALRLLLDSIRLILAARPPELIQAPLTVLVPVGQPDTVAAVAQHGTCLPFAGAEHLADFMAQAPGRECLVAVAPDRTFRAVCPVSPVNHTAAAVSAVVYHRAAGVEWIAAGTTNHAVLKLSTISASAFADPTISGLDEALDHYGQRVLESACELLKPVWAGGSDGPRLVLVNRPERIMRDALFQTLTTALRRADVTREHMVDADKPVDIRISWVGSPVEALIEIKWMGRSLTAPGSRTPYTDYKASRAQEGAGQLANYLDLKKSSSAKQSVVGYLVILDARRRKVSGPMDHLTRADATAFEFAELSFSPDHAVQRGDFKQPRRWFMRPREMHFLEAA